MLAVQPRTLGCGVRPGLDELKPVAQADLAQGDAVDGIEVFGGPHAVVSCAFPRAETIISVESPSSERTAPVSSPMSARSNPNAVGGAPSTSKGRPGARKVVPSGNLDRLSPPGRLTCGSSYISAGRWIGENGTPAGSKAAISSSNPRALTAPATIGMVQSRASI